MQCLTLEGWPGTFAEVVLPIQSWCPFLFLAEDHAFTALVCQSIVRQWPEVRFYLIVLDTHLDLFSREEDSRTVHRGNFLRYLLNQRIVTEEHLLVPSPYDPISSLQEGLKQCGEGLYYISWDLDFGLPQYAFFPSPFRLTSSNLREIFRLLGHHLRKPGHRLGGMDIVEINCARFSQYQHLAFYIATLLRPLAPQKLFSFHRARLDRFTSKKYAKYAQRQ